MAKILTSTAGAQAPPAPMGAGDPGAHGGSEAPPAAAEPPTAALAVPAAVTSLLSRYILAQTEPEEFRHILQENFGGRAPDAKDLVRVTIPTGGGTKWRCATPEGNEESEHLTGVIVHWKTARAMWIDKFGQAESGPPACASNGGEFGEGSPGGDCAKCFFNMWGSGDINMSDAVKAGLADGSRAPRLITELTAEIEARGNVKGGKKWCKEMRLVFMIRESDLMPIIISLPPMSIKPFLDYTRRLMNPGPLTPADQGGDGKARRPQPISGLISRMTLVTIPKAGKRPDYSEARFACVGVLGKDDRRLLEGRVSLLGPMFAAVRADDVDRAGVDAADLDGLSV